MTDVPLRLHLAHTVQADGTPEFAPEFLARINHAGNSGRRAAVAEAEARDLAAAERDYLSVPELAGLLLVDPTTIRKAIARGELAGTRPGGVYGHHRIGWEAAATYLASRGYDAGAVAGFRALWQSRRDGSGTVGGVRT